MTAKPFGEALKEARLAAGLSQAALARRAGLTGSYISVLESRRRRPPSDRVVRALCRVLGMAPGPLLEAAALERSPAPVRRRLERMRKERGTVARSRDRLLTTTLFHLARGPRVVDPMSEFMDLAPGQQALLGRLLGRLRRVRSLNEAEAKTDDLLADASPDQRDALVRVLPGVLTNQPTATPIDETSATPIPDDTPTEKPEELARIPVYDDLLRRGRPQDHILIDARFAEEAAFFWRAHGDETFPRIEAGDLVLIDPEGRVEEGHLVAFRHGGRDRVAYHNTHGEEVHLGFPRPDQPPVRLRKDKLELTGPVTLILRSLTPR